MSRGEPAERQSSSSAKDDQLIEASYAAASTKQPIDYLALYEQLKDAPCRVVQINKRYEGYNGGRFRTRAELLDRELEPIQHVKSLSELQAELDAAGRRLMQLGVFSTVEFLAHEEPLDDPTAATVDVLLEELNWLKLRAATYVQGGENTFELGTGLHNATGRAERLDVNVEYGTESSHTASLSYSQPRPGGLPLRLEVRGSQLTRNNQKASSFTERLRGAVLGFRSLDGSQGLEYELGWRTLMDPSRTASRAVMAQMGDYLKSALRYTFMLDRRDLSVGGAAAALGGAGWALRATTELAGLLPPDAATVAAMAKAVTGRAAAPTATYSTAAAGGGGGVTVAPAGGGFEVPVAAAAKAGSALQFVRQQVDAVLNVPMDDTGAVVFSLGVSAGLLLPWGPDALSRPSCIADRFFLGGPSTLRGFKFKGAGPTDVRRPPPSGTASSQSDTEARPRRDALGGDAYTSVFASLMFQLPHPMLQLLKAHGHAFVNGGNVIQLSGTARPRASLLSEFGSTFRWSCGLGLVLPTPFGRFEANYCVVLASQENDRLKRGLQLGFASNPLMQG